MQIEERKPTRTLWESQDAEGRKTYQWTANHPDGTAIEPSSCAHYSKRQADLAWKADNEAGHAGRPKLNRPAKDGNPTLQIRLAPEILGQIEQRGGAAWAREILLAALKNGETNS